MEHDVLQQQQQQQQQEEPMELPPGFRFHPTDEELITYYLARKTADPAGFAARAVGEADLNKCEPWDLPCRARMMGEKEGYFFVVKDRKYPTGTRTNRATESGYWKATGKDREILRGKALVGMKKTLVFYTGRAPRGGKTGWVMHEYRLEGKQHANASYSLPRAATSKDEWVLCRVFKKSLELPAAGNGKKGTSYTGMADVVVGSSTSMADYRVSSGVLPPLIDAAAGSGGTTFAPPTPAHVACFSNALEGQFLNPPFLLPSAPAMTNAPDHLAVDPASPFMASVQMQYAQEVAGGMVHELLQDGGGVWYPKGERERLSGGASQDTGLTSEVNPAEISSSRQHMDHEASFWGY